MPSYEEVTQRVRSLRSMTGLTEVEFTGLLLPFEQAFVRYMQDWTMDGQPRTSRAWSPYANSPLPTMTDKLLFILSYVKHNPIQEMQGQLFRMSQTNANKWIHLLQTVLNQALAQQDLLPARTADELARLLATRGAEGTSTPPLFGKMGVSVPSNGPKILKSNKNITVARKNATRSKTSL